MSLLTSLAGWASFGIIVRAYQQGIRKLPLQTYPMGYIYSGGFWVAFGYAFNMWDQNNDRLLAKRLENLQEARARRAAANVDASS
uniref:NADH-ubiquinone oxidoreductase 14 kDa subunit n=1 Tax=Pachysolen tannophilus NRRL Y-2460 TaxID=669874 RepID=A0A1E4TWH6_PACTA|nr:hypothetical protein PACTADRAFT_2320 [Pachysolen tannophilus NRRL Y-2460]